MLRLFFSLNALHQELEKLRLEVSFLQTENERLRAEVAEVSSLKAETARFQTAPVSLRTGKYSARYGGVLVMGVFL